MNAAVKKVIIFGATARTGLCILRCALRESLEVTAFVRTPSKVPEEFRNNIKIIQGDVLDRETVENALQGQDAVLSALGPPSGLGDYTAMSEGCRNIMAGMKKNGTRKLVVISVDFRFLPGRFQHYVTKAWTLIGDHMRQLDALKAESESIDWIAVMSPRIRYEEIVNPGYVVEKGKPAGDNWVTIGELADFMIKVVKDEEKFREFQHEYVGISSRLERGWFYWF